jgi:hypothetical protein
MGSFEYKTRANQMEAMLDAKGAVQQPSERLLMLLTGRTFPHPRPNRLTARLPLPRPEATWRTATADLGRRQYCAHHGIAFPASKPGVGPPPRELVAGHSLPEEANFPGQIGGSEAQPAQLGVTAHSFSPQGVLGASFHVPTLGLGSLLIANGAAPYAPMAFPHHATEVAGGPGLFEELPIYPGDDELRHREAERGGQTLSLETHRIGLPPSVFRREAQGQTRADPWLEASPIDGEGQTDGNTEGAFLHKPAAWDPTTASIMHKVRARAGCRPVNDLSICRPVDFIGE